MSKLNRSAKQQEAIALPSCPPGPPARDTARPRRRIVPLLITLATVALAVPLGRAMWNAYMGAPWTRDGTVRAYVVTMAPEVAGRIVELPVVDNQFVRKGDLLMVIDPTNYRIAVSNAEAAVQRAEADVQNARNEAKRRRRLKEQGAVSAEELETHETNAVVAQAQYQQALANREQARVNLERTQIRSPVNGWVTNLAVRLGDYAIVGKSNISVVDADSFWVDGYFEETTLEFDPRRRHCQSQADGLQPDRSWPRRQHRARHQRPKRASQPARAGCGQPDLHLGAPCPARSGPHPHR